MSDEEVIASQARKIEILEHKVKDLEDSVFRRNQWLTKAKRDADYPPTTSFDEVWADALEALKTSRNKK